MQTSKLRFLLYSLLLAVSVSLISCGDDEESSSINPQDLLTSKKWLGTSAPLKASASVFGITVPELTFDFDAVDSLATCNQDDLVVFNSNGSLVLESGATQCPDETSSSSNTGSWSLSADGNTLTVPTQYFATLATAFGLEAFGVDLVEIAGASLDFDVERLTETQLQIRLQDQYPVDFQGITATLDLNVQINYSGQ